MEVAMISFILALYHTLTACQEVDGETEDLPAISLAEDVCLYGADILPKVGTIVP